MAAKVPAAVEMAVASRETSRVIYRLSIISLFRNSSLYQWKLSPFHTALLSPALKENTIRRKIGK